MLAIHFSKDLTTDNHLLKANNTQTDVIEVILVSLLLALKIFSPISSVYSLNRFLFVWLIEESYIKHN